VPRSQVIEYSMLAYEGAGVRGFGVARSRDHPSPFLRLAAPVRDQAVQVIQ